MSDTYSFCESLHATGFTRWHIRRLTETGQKFGGGADTDSLCGRKMAWDVNVEITVHHLANSACRKCADEYIASRPLERKK